MLIIVREATATMTIVVPLYMEERSDSDVDNNIMIVS